MGLIKTAARVAVASSVHGRVQERQRQRWAAQEQWDQAPAAPVQAARSRPSGGDPEARIAQLKALGELRTSGVLTDAEFEAEKRKILQS